MAKKKSKIFQGLRLIIILTSKSDFHPFNAIFRQKNSVPTLSETGSEVTWLQSSASPRTEHLSVGRIEPSRLYVTTILCNENSHDIS